MSGELIQHIHELALRVEAAVVFPFVQFVFRESIFWWPYLLSAFAIALIGFWLGRGRGWAALGEFRRRFLGRAIWAHESARADYAFYLINGALYPLVVGPLVVTGAGIGALVEHALARAFGPMSAPLFGLGPARVLYTVAFFLVFDFSRFFAHGLLHDVPLLWQFHKVHHSAEVLTPITTFRGHPVELFMMDAIPNVATGLLSGLVWYLSAGEIGVYTFFGLHVVLAAFNVFANLRHSQVWISFGPVLNLWLISPAHHQLHHSREARHFGKNRGFALAVWDRMFGTLYVPREEEQFAMGLGDGTDGAWHSVGRMYVWPVRYALALLGLGTAPALPAAPRGETP